MKSGSRLERILTSGQFAVTGELGPPKNSDPEVVRQKARLLKGSVDAVNITDCQTAIVRMSSIGAGLIALDEGYRTGNPDDLSRPQPDRHAERYPRGCRPGAEEPALSYRRPSEVR